MPSIKNACFQKATIKIMRLLDSLSTAKIKRAQQSGLRWIGNPPIISGFFIKTF